jgi:hypothetical protein
MTGVLISNLREECVDAIRHAADVRRADGSPSRPPHRIVPVRMTARPGGAESRRTASSR